MANLPKKAAVVVLDNVAPALFQKYIAEGRLPALKKLSDGGAGMLNCLAPYPASGPTCQASITTGTWPGTHAITGSPTDASNSRAQHLWEAADQAGKKCIVLNFPGAERSNLQHGIILQGPEAGKTPDYIPALTSAATALLSKNEWDLFFLLAGLPRSNQAGKEDPLDHYQALDRMLAALLELSGRETLIAVASTPAAITVDSAFDVAGILAKAGLTVFGRGEKSRIPEPGKSRCWPLGQTYIQVNLKGRDPDGIVEPGDYMQVQHQVIDALLTFTDPATGMRPVTLALTKEDARLLGLHGDSTGDVVYALHSRYARSGTLPTAINTDLPRCWLTFSGPGIKKGAAVERTCCLPDVVPTLCYMMALPLPEQAEGNVIYQALKNPGSITREMERMEDALYRMDYAGELGQRQAWDRHWSAGKYDRLFPTGDR